MSKIYRPFLLTLAGAVLVLQAFSYSVAQDVEAIVHVVPKRSMVHVEGKFFKKESASEPLSFLSEFAGIRFPVDRISNVRHNGQSWSYDVSIAPMGNPSSAAHVSWLTPERGVLMLADLFPRMRDAARISAKVSLIVPDALWSITTAEKRQDDGSYWFYDVEKAVCFLRFESGSTLDVPVRSEGFGLFMSGTLTVPAAKTTKLIDEVYRRYTGLFGDSKEPLLGVSTHPTKGVQPRWEADTRGRTITIVTSESTFESQSLQQLHEQLRHEMFHLWIPEGVNLTGSYDWFYEGFALYQSLKLGVTVNRIRFDDYLDTLSRAYDVDRRLGSKLSLIDASKNRWSGDNNTVIYARGMLVAFLCDLALLEVSKGKRSTDELVREVYRRHSGQAVEQDGNEAVISILRENSDLGPIINAYVTGTRQLEWTNLISKAGLSAGAKSGVTTLSVVPKPSSSQKHLLDKLGYNNWRKLLPK